MWPLGYTFVKPPDIVPNYYAVLLIFDQSVREGNQYVFDRESENDGIGLSFSLKNISSTGATLVFSQYDENVLTGELIPADTQKAYDLTNRIAKMAYIC